jgi:hypothetical protein
VLVQRLVGVADAGEHVCDWIGQHRLPAAFGHAWDHALVCQVPQADPAQAELAEHGARAAAAVAPAVGPHRVLLWALLLDPK